MRTPTTLSKQVTSSADLVCLSRQHDNDSRVVNPVKRGGRGEFGRGDDAVGTIRRQHPAHFTTMHNLARILSILLVTILAVLAQQRYEEVSPVLFVDFSGMTTFLRISPDLYTARSRKLSGSHVR